MSLITLAAKTLNKTEKPEEPPYSYETIMNLEEKYYPEYLKKLYKYKTGKNLNLRNPSTYNEKIQWLKLYDNLQIKTTLTDKIAVREWVGNQIGEKFLKPILWIGTSFDEIPFDKLPDRFFIKTNHGCKWHCYIKDKNKFLNEDKLFRYIKIRFDNWMSQSFFGWSAFELQYKNIQPKIFIEPVLFNEEEVCPLEVEVYCFDSNPKLFRLLKYADAASETIYDENFNLMSSQANITFADEVTKNKLYYLSEILSKGFKLVRVDWIIFNDTLYFNELTFTPGSGLVPYEDKKLEKFLNSCLKIK